MGQPIVLKKLMNFGNSCKEGDNSGEGSIVAGIQDEQSSQSNFNVSMINKDEIFLFFFITIVRRRLTDMRNINEGW